MSTRRFHVLYCIICRILTRILHLTDASIIAAPVNPPGILQQVGQPTRQLLLRRQLRKQLLRLLPLQHRPPHLRLLRLNLIGTL